MVTRMTLPTSGSHRYHATKKGLQEFTRIRKGASQSIKKSIIFTELLARLSEMNYEVLVLKVASSAFEVREDKRSAFVPILEECAGRIASRGGS